MGIIMFSLYFMTVIFIFQSSTIFLCTSEIHSLVFMWLVKNVNMNENIPLRYFTQEFVGVKKI